MRFAMSPIQTHLSSAIKRPVIITGANGTLATDLIDTFRDLLPPHLIIPLSKKELNISDRDGVLYTLRRLQPEIILNTAAYTHVDQAESHRREAFDTNVIGSRYLSQAAKELGAQLIHFSTDQVFDGTANRPYTEKDTPNPPNYYAITKYLGEEEILKHRDAIVLRVQWLYGKRKDRFTPLANLDTFTPFEDQYGAPTWTRDISHTVVSLLQARASGLFHFSYDDFASLAEVFSFVKEEKGYHVKLIPLKTDQITLPAYRPRYCALSNKKLLKVLGQSEMGSWKASLRAFLQTR